MRDLLTDDDIDLSPEVMCMLARRRQRTRPPLSTSIRSLPGFNTFPFTTEPAVGWEAASAGQG